MSDGPPPAEAPAYCDDDNDGLRCDLQTGHAGDWHEEIEVARWRRDGSDVREFVGWGKSTGRRIYRTAAAKGLDAP